MPVLKNIYRYPIKGLSAQPLTRIDLEARKPMPFDRIFALVRPGAPFDTSDPKWGKKGLFVMLMLEEALARVSTTLDVETLQLTIRQDNHQRLVADLGDEEACAPGRRVLLATRSVASQRAQAGSVARRAFHGQAGQCDVVDQSGDCAKA